MKVPSDQILPFILYFSPTSENIFCGVCVYILGKASRDHRLQGNKERLQGETRENKHRKFARSSFFWVTLKIHDEKRRIKKYVLFFSLSFSPHTTVSFLMCVGPIPRNEIYYFITLFTLFPLKFHNDVLEQLERRPSKMQGQF